MAIFKVWDIRGRYGKPILASADGEVVVANGTNTSGYGYYVRLRHNDTYQTQYSHCSAIAVTNGQVVKKGQVIAYIGSTGNSTGNHIHFEVYQNGSQVDPLSYFRQ